MYIKKEDILERKTFRRKIKKLKGFQEVEKKKGQDLGRRKKQLVKG